MQIKMCINFIKVCSCQLSATLAFIQNFRASSQIFELSSAGLSSL